MGEINNYDAFGSAIINTIKRYNLKNNLEIGSWDGTGSTQCFIEGMKDFDTKSLTCLELRTDRYQHLVNNTSQYNWVKCYNMTTVSYESLIYKNFEDVWSSPYNGIPDNEPGKKDLVNKWFVDDTGDIKKFGKGFLETYPDEKYDGVLIDGGEFSGYTEFLMLKDRTNVFFLDDYYNAFKTRQVAAELEKDNEWEPIIAEKNTRNGFAVIKKKTFL